MKMKAIVKRFIRDERGLETVEYAIILGLVVATTIVLVLELGKWVSGTFGETVEILETNAPVPVPTS